jgi:oxygen-independent coproporphyrinogen III oxidase
MSLGIYIQVPFCQTKCTYCNFATGPAAKSLWRPYVDAVCREIREHAALNAASRVAANFHTPAFGRGDESGPSENRSYTASVDTVYVGGGTPSLLDTDDLERIVTAVRDTFTMPSDVEAPLGAPRPTVECTLEADPETITAEKAAAWRAMGFNRISMGVQSFHDAELKAAGRMHRRADIFAAADHLRAAGFDNLSFDLIAGLPHQTAASWEASLEELLDLAPEHVSIYLLEIDEGSRLGRASLAGLAKYGADALPTDEQMAGFYERAAERLEPYGYLHYEISNWALAGRESRHNRKYWRREPYRGFGAGAHSFDGRVRWANAHDPAAYTAAIGGGRLPVEQREELTASQALDEELFLGLRQMEGIEPGEIERKYGVALGPRIAPLVAAGLLEPRGARIRLAPAKLAVSNEVFVELMGAGAG